jgi:hypothetical protein
VKINPQFFLKTCLFLAMTSVFNRTTLKHFEFLTSLFWVAFLKLRLNGLQVAVVNGLKWLELARTG